MKKISEIGNISVKMEEHRLNEMARIDDPHHDFLPKNIKIYVYGENDEQATKVPHFHVIGEDFEFEVKIEHIYYLDIWRTKFIKDKSNANTWNERRKIRDAIAEWLDNKNYDMSPLSNASTIVAQWNQNNPDHKIPKNFKD